MPLVEPEGNAATQVGQARSVQATNVADMAHRHVVNGRQCATRSRLPYTGGRVLGSFLLLELR
eukprot:2044499-Prorocentrum_lima.AAC.1